MDRDWTFEVGCSRGWAAASLLLCLALMGGGMLAAAWGLLHLEEGTLSVSVAAMAGTLAMFVFGGAGLVAFAKLVRSPEPVVVVDAFGILDRRITGCIIPWSAIRRARRRGRRLALDVDRCETFMDAPDGPVRWLFGRSRGPLTISMRGLTCPAREVEAAIQKGLRHKQAMRMV